MIVNMEDFTINAPQPPTREQWARHKATHTPYKACCPQCVAARAIRRDHPSRKLNPHLVPDIVESEEGPVIASMDYMYLRESVSEYNGEETNLPYLVVVEHRYGRCWAYQAPNKGFHYGAHWLPIRFVQDWGNCGMEGARVMFKSDQEPAITSVQSAGRELRQTGSCQSLVPLGGRSAMGEPRTPYEGSKRKSEHSDMHWNKEWRTIFPTTWRGWPNGLQKYCQNIRPAAREGLHTNGYEGVIVRHHSWRVVRL